MMHWPYRWCLMWHPDSPGTRVTVQVRWPRYLWLRGLDERGFPQDFATLKETIRMYRSRNSI